MTRRGLGMIETVVWISGLALLMINTAFPPYHFARIVTTHGFPSSSGIVVTYSYRPYPESPRWRAPLIPGPGAREIAGHTWGIDEGVEWFNWSLWSLATVIGTLIMVGVLRLYRRILPLSPGGFEVMHVRPGV